MWTALKAVMQRIPLLLGMGCPGNLYWRKKPKDLPKRRRKKPNTRAESVCRLVWCSRNSNSGLALMFIVFVRSLLIPADVYSSCCSCEHTRKIMHHVTHKSTVCVWWQDIYAEILFCVHDPFFIACVRMCLEIKHIFLARKNITYMNTLLYNQLF